MPLTVATIIQHLKAHGTESVLDAKQVVDHLRQALVPRTALDLIDEWYPWARDQRLALDLNAPEGERMAAIGRITSGIRWHPNARWGGRQLRAWDELRARAIRDERSIADVKAEILAEAVVLVLGSRDEVRRMRVGVRRGSFDLREEDGGPTGVRAADLPYSADAEVAPGAPAGFVESPYLYWFRREVQKAATAILLDERYPPAPRPRRPPRKRRAAEPADPTPLLDKDHDALQALLERGTEHNADVPLLRLLAVATPAQLALWKLRAQGMSIAAAARALGIAPATGRYQLKLLRDKLKPPPT